MLHIYFKVNEKPKQDFYIVMTACVLASCKSFEIIKPISEIMKALLCSCDKLSKDHKKKGTSELLKQCMGLDNFNDRSPTETELLAVRKAELDVLESHSFKSYIPLSFDITEKIVDPVIKNLDPSLCAAIQKEMRKIHCVALCCDGYLEMPLDVVAMIVTEKSFGNWKIPDAIQNWIRNVAKDNAETVVEKVRVEINRMEDRLMGKRNDQNTDVPQNDKGTIASLEAWTPGSEATGVVASHD
jgi:hypothetical protein